ncbi:MAG: alkaline phosphatase family protein [Acidobacteria bacterium]|nr:alkaline phosphatase family protein [Acidobacteriota bacterium]
MNKKIFLIIAIVIILVLLLCSIKTVEDNTVALAKPNFLFKKTVVLKKGFNLVFPFIYTINTYPMTTIAMEDSKEIEITDRLGAKRNIQVTFEYQIIENRLDDLSNTSGDLEAFILEQATITSVEYLQKTSSFKIQEIGKYSSDILQLLNSSLGAYGLKLNKFEIVNIALDYGNIRSNELNKIRKYYEQSGRKVILIGMDALDLQIMQPLLNAGELPNFAKVIKGGSSGVLKSIRPMLSPLIWTTIATGVSPDAHGILDFVQKNDQGNLVPITSDMRKVPAMWNILSAMKLPVGFVAWWATWPAEDVDGFIISERLAYQLYNMRIDKTDMENPEGKVFPAGDYAEINRLIKHTANVSYETVQRFINISPSEWNSEKNKSLSAGDSKIVMLRNLIASTEAYHIVSLQLYKKYKPILFSPYFEGTDVIGHLFMEYTPPKRDNVSEVDFDKYKNAVNEYYKYIDVKLGDYINLVDDKTDLMIVSDHGFKSGMERPFGSADIKAATAVEWHDIDGTIILYGKSFKERFIINDASVYDILPTVFSILNLPKAKNMRGRVLTEAFVTAPNPPKDIEDYSILVPVKTGANENLTNAYDKEMIERLKALGYIGDDTVSNSGTDTSRINKAAVLIQDNKYDEAEQLLLNIIKEEPKTSVAWLMLAKIYNTKNDKEKELNAYMKALDNATEQADVEDGIIGASLILHDLKKIDREIGLVKMGLKDFPNSFKLKKFLGNLYFEESKYFEAIELYEKILQMKSDEPSVINELAKSYFMIGNVDKAMENWNKCFQMQPDLMKNNKYYYVNRGIVRGKAGDSQNAMNDLRQALKIDPEYSLTWTAIGNVYLGAKEYKNAEVSFRKGITFAKKTGDKASAYMGLIMTYNATGNSELEKLSLKAAVKEVPDSNLIHRMYGFYLLSKMEYDSAKHEFETAITLNKNDYLSMNRLGALYAREGKIDAALKLFKDSLVINPDQPKIRETIRQMEAQK